MAMWATALGVSALAMGGVDVAPGGGGGPVLGGADAEPVTAENMIAPGRIGPARVGSTLAAFETAMGGSTTFDAYHSVDHAAVCALEGGVETVCALIPSSENKPGGGVMVQALVTADARFRTTEGVGPGVRVKDAAPHFGGATFAFDWDKGGQEMIEFDFGPGPEFTFFAPASEGAARVGQYAAAAATKGSTRQFPEDAVIGAIKVR